MTTRRITSLGAASIAAALLLTGCSGSSGDSADASGKDADSSRAVMYTSNNETTVGVVTDAAAALSPSLKVDVVTGSSVPLLQRIQAEDGVNSADVFYSAPSDSLEEFTDLLAPYMTTEIDAIPAELVAPDDLWTVTNTHVVAFMVNTDQLGNNEVPTTWKELTDSKWAGKLISADPEQSSTAFTALYGAYKVLGEADFTKLVQNLEVSVNSSNVYPAVAQGEYAVAIGYESNIYPYIAGGQPGIEMHYPTDGTFVAHDAAVLLKKATNPEAGKRLMDTLLSKEAQENNLKESFRRPVRTDINPSDFVDFPKLDDLKVVPIDTDEDAAGKDEFTAFWATVK